MNRRSFTGRILTGILAAPAVALIHGRPRAEHPPLPEIPLPELEEPDLSKYAIRRIEQLERTIQGLAVCALADPDDHWMKHGLSIGDDGEVDGRNAQRAREMFNHVRWLNRVHGRWNSETGDVG